MTNIYATGNENISGNFNVSYYIIEKDEKFLDWLGNLLLEVLQIKDGKNRAKFIFKEADQNHEEEIYAKEISKMVDVHEYYSNNGDRADIFYGNNRIYLTLRKSEETRLKLTKFIRKTKDWIKIEESKKHDAPYLRKVPNANI